MHFRRRSCPLSAAPCTDKFIGGLPSFIYIHWLVSLYVRVQLSLTNVQCPVCVTLCTGLCTLVWNVTSWTDRQTFTRRKRRVGDRACFGGFSNENFGTLVDQSTVSNTGDSPEIYSSQHVKISHC